MRLVVFGCALLLSSYHAVADVVSQQAYKVDRYVYCLVSEKSGSEKTYIGTGVQLKPGLVATVAHQVNGMDRITAYRGEHAISAGSVVVMDVANDLALIKIEPFPGGIGFKRLAEAEQSEGVFGIGCPYGLFHAITQGVVRNPLASVDGQRVIQVTMPIKIGDSGGPVFDLHGQWLGLVTGYLKRTPEVGVVIPVDLLVALVNNSVDLWR
ncbi:MAG: trypsin-like peptidase domain-containing protein [Methylococcales bacterium]|jgi:serine protease Do|nr:trypsin-like peptidase domain-containing protein [Methylococcales bacterium]